MTNSSLPLQNCKQMGTPRLAKEIHHLLYCEIAHDWLRELPFPRQESLNVRENSFKTITAYLRRPVYIYTRGLKAKCYTYRLFATRVSQLKIWHFLFIGIERNVADALLTGIVS
jgi:hypothetical protein